MGFWATFILTLLGILKDTLPLLLKWLNRDNTPLSIARNKALELQQQAADTARLIREEKGDELSRSENFKLATLEQLFKQRKLRKTPSTKPTSE